MTSVTWGIPSVFPFHKNNLNICTLYYQTFEAQFYLSDIILCTFRNSFLTAQKLSLKFVCLYNIVDSFSGDFSVNLLFQSDQLTQTIFHGKT